MRPIHCPHCSSGDHGRVYLCGTGKDPESPRTETCRRWGDEQDVRVDREIERRQMRRHFEEVEE